MAEIDIVRSYCQDKPVPQTYTLATGSPVQVFLLPFYPVVASSVVIAATSFGAIVPTFSVEGSTGRITGISDNFSGTYSVIYNQVLLPDSDIQNFIDTEAATDLRLAAADALDAVASSQALILKKIKMLDLQTDGPALADSLRKHAVMLRKQVLDPSMQMPEFDIIEMINDDAGFNEKIRKDFMRDS